MSRFAWTPLLLACALLAGCPGPDNEPTGGVKKTGADDDTKVSTATEDEAPPIDQDVSKVKVGQVYTWSEEIPFKKESTWTITGIVKNKEIHYDLVSVTTVELEGMESAPPTKEGPTPQVAPLPPREPEGTKTDETARIIVSEQEFPCVIYRTEDGVTTWYSDIFPFVIKREKGGKSLGSLTAIKPPPAKAPAQKTE